ncbi:MAG: hypothetical protein LBI92_11675 [Azoarcus sp.]|nr:hypothetical protein [Azoarcus sp.]
MSLFSPLPDTAPAGERARHRAGRCLLLALAATLPAVLLLMNANTLLAKVATLQGAAFSLTSFLAGAVLVVPPVIALAGWVLAFWHGVGSVYLPRSRPTPILDRVLVGIGLVVWFLPALAFVGTAVASIWSGRVHFVRPARDYMLATDPIAFWQGVGFLLVAGAVFAWGAWRFWQGKLRRGPDEEAAS